MVCKTEVINRQHQLPRASRRRHKNQSVHVCKGCLQPFYVERTQWYSMDGIGSKLEWVALAEQE